MVRKFFLLAILFDISLYLTGTERDSFVQTSDSLIIATFNVRIRTSSDVGVRSWEMRRLPVANLIEKWEFDIFGVQELIDQQQENDLSALLTDFEVYSKGRDNTSGTEGERIAIYYRKDRFLALEMGYFFLSETPEVASKGWDAALNRMCNWVLLKDQKSGFVFYVFNTHFDHVGIAARAGSAQLVVSKMRQIAGNQPVFCLGDFNAGPSEVKVYETLTNYLNDSRSIANTIVEESAGTFNGWNIAAFSFPGNVRIDYIFTSLKNIMEYKVITDRYLPDAYPSDHFPVMIKVRLPRQ